MRKETKKIVTVFKLLKWSKILLFSAFLILLSTLSYAQQIGLEKDWSESHNDKFINLDSDLIFNSNGRSQRDSIAPFPMYPWIYIDQNIISRIKNNLNISNDTFLHDTILVSNIKVWAAQIYFRFLTNSSANNSIILTGEWSNNQPTYQGDILNISLDTNLNIIWAKFLNLYPLSDVKASTYSKVFSNGNILVAGQHQSNFSPTGTDIFASMLDINGNQLWSKRYYINEFQVPWYSTELSDGSLLLCGRNNNSAMFFKVNPINGDSLQMHTSLTIPFADNSKLDVKYLEERSNHTYLSMVYDGSGQGYICKLDTNFNLLSSFSTNAAYDNFFRVNDNEFVGYKQDAPVSVYAFDSLGAEKWNLQLTTPEYVNFTPDGQGGLMGAGHVEDNNGNSDFYLVRIDIVGYPAGPICNNPPQVQIATASVVGSNKSVNLSGEAIENLKYSDVIAYNWYFEDGNSQYGQNVNYDFDETQYPNSFWCMLVVTDGVGCTDTLTIDAFTGAIVFPNPVWPPENPNSMEEKAHKNAIVKPRIYPNPFNNEITIEFNNSLIKNYSINVFDVYGKSVQTLKQLEKGNSINLKSLSKGIYIIEIKTPDYIYTEKAIKE